MSRVCSPSGPWPKLGFTWQTLFEGLMISILQSCNQYGFMMLTYSRPWDHSDDPLLTSADRIWVERYASILSITIAWRIFREKLWAVHLTATRLTVHPHKVPMNGVPRLGCPLDYPICGLSFARNLYLAWQKTPQKSGE